MGEVKATPSGLDLYHLGKMEAKIYTCIQTNL